MNDSKNLDSLDIGVIKGHQQLMGLTRTITDNIYDNPSRKGNPLTVISNSFKKAINLPQHKIYLTSGHTASVLSIVFKKVLFNDDITLIVRSNDRFFYFQSFPFYQRILHKWISLYIDGVIAISDMVKNYVETNTECPIRKVNVFLRDSSYLDVNPNLSSGNIVSIGTQYPRKGNDVLKRLDEKLREEKNYNGEVFVLGRKDPIPAYIREYAEKQPKFHLVGYTEPKDYLKKGCFYVQPSRFDAACTSVLEAMGAGLIPLVSENTGNKELVRKIDKGLILDNRAEEYYRKITELMNLDRDEKEVLSKKAKEIASKYTWKRAKKDFDKSVMELIEKTGKPL